MIWRNLKIIFFFFSSRRRHTRFDCDWSSDVCSSDLLRRNFDAAIHRTGMEDDCIRLGATEAFGVELVKEHVIRGGKGRLVETLGLDAENEYDVRAFKSFLDAEDAANRSAGRTDFLELARDPHRGTAKCQAAAKFAEEVDIGASDA